MNHWDDLETFSREPIKNGTHKYAEGAEVMLWSYALEDFQIKVWDLTDGTLHWEEEDDFSGAKMWRSAPCFPGAGPGPNGMPPDLQLSLSDPEVLVWFHNGGMFDFVVLDKALPSIGRNIPLSRRRDTMVQAFCHGLPGALDKLGVALNIDEAKRKDTEGKKYIHLFCKPQSEAFIKKYGTDRATKQTHPEEWAGFIRYAGRDITVMREAHRKMPKWNYTGRQVELWHIDLTINQRGFKVDQELATAAVAAVAEAREVLNRRTVEVTDGVVEAATQRDKLLEWILASHGVELPNMQADTLERRLGDPDLPTAVRELIGIRLQASMNSVSKYRTLLRAVSSDGRLRGGAQFRGAFRTGRWAHRLFQHGNMPRMDTQAVARWWGIAKDDVKKHHVRAYIDLGVAALKAGTAELTHGDVVRLASCTIRSTIVAEEGRKLVVADLSNIEGRVAAWLAGEEWKLQAFRDYDTIIGTDDKGKPVRKGHDLYRLAYAGAFNVEPESVNDDQRQIGKVCVAAGQRVLTHVGLVSIEQVKPWMRVWDGLQWVRHDGVLCSGTKEVMTYEGLTATPDHKVWIEEAQEPVQLIEAARRGSRLVQSGSGGQPVRILVGDLTGTPVHHGLVGAVRGSAVPEVHARLLGGVLEPHDRQEQGLHALQQPSPGSEVVERQAGGSEGSVHQPRQQAVGPLRCAGDSFQLPFGAGSRAVRDEDFGCAAADCGAGPRGQRRPLRARQSPLGVEETEQEQHFPLTASGLGSEGMAVRQESRKPAASSRHDTGAGHRGCVGGGLTEEEKLAWHSRKIDVYDIVNAGPHHRFTVSGKLVANCELMLGYGGGVGAFLTGAATYGIDLTELGEVAWPNIPADVIAEAESFRGWIVHTALLSLFRKLGLVDKKSKTVTDEQYQAALEAADPVLVAEAQAKVQFGLTDKVFVVCDSLKRMWRRAHPQISSYWKELEDAAKAAVLNPGKLFVARKLKFRRDGAWLRMGLPSGRVLCYPNPEVSKKDGTLSYMGLNQYSRKYERLSTYGGKLLENGDQAVAADQLSDCMPAIEAANYPIVFHVHDEIAAETPDTGDFTAEELAAMMAAELDWNQGLPLSAAGFETYAYYKG